MYIVLLAYKYHNIKKFINIEVFKKVFAGFLRQFIHNLVCHLLLDTYLQFIFKRLTIVSPSNILACLLIDIVTFMISLVTKKVTMTCKSNIVFFRWSENSRSIYLQCAKGSAYKEGAHVNIVNAYLSQKLASLL